ncbi:hypothetical protein MMC22_004849 [Lobaria immixta]|nr:hypothetical protein [Lobaria immixta]
MTSKSKAWDPDTDKTLKAMRAFFAQNPLPSLSVWQRISIKERPVVGPIWVSRVSFPPAEDALRDQLMTAIRSISRDGGQTITPPSVDQVQAEWTGYRKGVGPAAPEPSLPESTKFENLMKDVTSHVTMLYVHGGGYCRGSPSGWRSSVAELAKLTGGRCLSLRYRLAPQNPFPHALFDLLVAYLSLLYPPQDSFHDPVKAGNIVIVGDSCGASLCLALVQFILELHRRHSSPCTVQFHDEDVILPLPAGVASFSAYGEPTHTLPSWISNRKHDVFTAISPYARLPPDEIWPTVPPRGNVYCDISTMCHPLVAPTLAENWKGAPPIWLCCGEEMLADESKVIAQRAVSQGCTVIWIQYEIMPHTFPFLLKVPQTLHSLTSCANFCRACVYAADGVTTQGSIVDRLMSTRPVDVTNLINVSFDELKDGARKEMNRQASDFAKAMVTKAKI